MTNNQAEAYAKRALKEFKIPPKMIEQILNEMRYLFDTVDEVTICRREFGCDY